jgi:hypothetical protein
VVIRRANTAMLTMSSKRVNHRLLFCRRIMVDI